MKNAALTLFLLVCMAIPSHGQQAQGLFFTEVTTQGNTMQNRVLSPAEHRSRIAGILPHGSVGSIDLTQPLTIHLFDDVTYTVRLESDNRSALQGLEVWKGRVADSRFDHLPHYRNTVLVLNKVSGRLVANIETQEGFFQILPTETAGQYRIRQCKTFENSMCRFAEQPQTDHRELASRAVCGSTCYDEMDEDGKYFLDVFAGYSDEAAAVAGDLEAHAQVNIETVNMGLANSMSDMAYLRLVGTATTHNNPGIIPSVLSDAWTWFAAEIAELAPDFIAIFQTPTDAPDSAGGWGHVPGRSSVNGVEWGGVFRHEFGHNVGGGHCYPDIESHFNGYDNGNWRTHLCGNDVNFYSTPLVNDNLGNPIGNVNEADMVRGFEETAAMMATYAMHRIPLFEGDPCVDQLCLPQHWGDVIESITRVQFHTIDNQQDDPGYSCSAVNGYSDFTDEQTDVVTGNEYVLTITSDFSWAESTIRAWIDWDNDGILSSEEQVADLVGNGPWSANVTVPEDAAIAPVRMRIRLQYGLADAPGPCNGSGYSSGETEDYTVNITAPLPTSINSSLAAGGVHWSFSLFPNPTRDVTTLELVHVPAGMVTIVLRNTVGQQVFVQQHMTHDGDDTVTLDVSSLPAGIYICELHHGNHGILTDKLVRH